MNNPPPFLIKVAVEAARRSPCAKSKRGVVIADGELVLGIGCNAPPPGFVCEGSDACRAACAKVAVHAEQSALLRAVGEIQHLERTSPRAVAPLALHVKVVDNELVAGGGPSCVDCSKLLLAGGVMWVWLYEARPDGDAWVQYDAEEFHRLSLAAHRYPGG